MSEQLSLGPHVMSPAIDLRALAMRIKRTVRRQTSGGVRQLNVEIEPEAIRLSGHCNSFYCKQLATHAAQRLSGSVPVANDIIVAAD
jgi:BON domain